VIDVFVDALDVDVGEQQVDVGACLVESHGRCGVAGLDVVKACIATPVHPNSLRKPARACDDGRIADVSCQLVSDAFA
jgi:hypothetical protein